MSNFNKRFLRLASAIRLGLGPTHDRNGYWNLPVSTWHDAAQLAQQIERAEQHGWRLAAARLRGDLRYALTRLNSDVTACLHELPSRLADNSTPSASEIFRDLVSLAEEYEEIDFDLQERWLSVTTEAITLRGVYLGPFEIRLDWTELRSRDTGYRVIAKDPHPPQSRENVTHPHIMDETLCEGHSRQAIRQALGQGRLLDFFTLVRSGLRSYNDESPFVELALWQGCTCADCGSVVEEDERFTCHRCGDEVCSECETSCTGCEESCCFSCVSKCSSCDQFHCGNCRRRCRGCQGAVCLECLQEDERCNTCHENDEESAAEAAPPATGAEIQPDGVGQAALPA